MKPILPGVRGPAVEDIQRRLLTLGYDLGPTRVDGVFLGKTREAVIGFQAEHALSEDGIVGDETWSALVDATFTLGDRTLYLRLPYFHGRDVRVLQEALNALGFSCGEPDGIFGVYSERAAREFQRNSGQHDDGIVGPETVRAIVNLRHVWEGKDPHMPSDATVSASRRIDVLVRTSILVHARDPFAREVAERFVNLALATAPEASVAIAEDDTPGPADLVIEVSSVDSFADELPLITLGKDAPVSLSGRLITALQAQEGSQKRIAVDVTDLGRDEHEVQRAVVHLLDGACAALA